MSELPMIQETLRKAAARRRLEHALHGLWTGLLAGTALWLASVAVYKIFPVPPGIAEWGWLAAIVGAIGGFIVGAWRTVSLATAARILENRQALKQRLSTALEVAADPNPTAWTRLVVADAAAAVRSVDPARLLPIGLPRFARWIPVGLALVVGLGFVPEYRSKAHREARRDAELIRDTGRKLAELIRREEARREPAQESIRQAMEAGALLGDRLSQVQLTKAEAVTDLANAAKRLEEQARQLDSEPLLRRLQQAARTPAAGGTANNPALQRQLDKLRENLGGSNADELQKLAEQLQKAQQMAAGMQGNPPNGDAEQALSQALNQLAQTASELGLNLSSLNDALDSLKNLNIDRVLRDLNLAGTDLEKLRDMAKKLAEMEKSMQQSGKDLAEQLERGQADLAAQTLDKMVEQLQSAGLSPEQMQKMLEEISKALKPASEYGKVSELLKAGLEKLGSSEKSEAGKDLAQAADELRKLAKEAEDLQQLATTLQALEGAQLALMNNRLWQYGAQCKGGNCAACANGTCIRSGPGGKPGRGVGTWADENGWMYYPEISERWDNTGLERPDMAPRGHTDRGEGKLSENALPTKLTGRFTPGPMPAITLKGVNIKGESTVQYRQAVEAAQSEAQSALNQDQVPRAYRGAVKGYFDDLN